MSDSTAAQQPCHDNGTDVWEVVDDEGHIHCLHRSEGAARACAAWFGAEAREVYVHE